MNCPKCNKVLRIGTEQVGVDENNLPIFHRFAYCDDCRLKKDIDINTDEKKTETKEDNPLDRQAVFAKNELEKLKKTNSDPTFGYIASGLVVFSSIVSFLNGDIGLGISLIILSLIALFSSLGYKARRNELQQIAAGKKILNVCPRCKSDNITMQMVQTGSFTMHDKSRVSKNINPLRPFTHTNIKMGNDYSKSIYGNQCHCLNCGYVFSRPEIHYI